MCACVWVWGRCACVGVGFGLALVRARVPVGGIRCVFPCVWVCVCAPTLCGLRGQPSSALAQEARQCRSGNGCHVTEIWCKSVCVCAGGPCVRCGPCVCVCAGSARGGLKLEGGCHCHQRCIALKDLPVLRASKNVPFQCAVLGRALVLGRWCLGWQWCRVLSGSVTTWGGAEAVSNEHGNQLNIKLKSNEHGTEHGNEHKNQSNEQ